MYRKSTNWGWWFGVLVLLLTVGLGIWFVLPALTQDGLFALVKYELALSLAWGLLMITALWFGLRVGVKVGWGWTMLIIVLLLASAGLYRVGNTAHDPHFAMPEFMHTYHPGGHALNLPYTELQSFMASYPDLEFLDEIGADPTDVPPPIDRDYPETVEIFLETQEVIAEVAPDVYFNYWTFNQQVPGPMLRVREGDTINMTIRNHPSSTHGHNIDLHAVTGAGGGSTLSRAAPGETKQFSWKALQPGLYIYHCATANVSTHNSHGQYGLILVEPAEGLPLVDKEFYVVQGELYTQGAIGKKGIALFDSQKLLDGNPTYVTFNGRIEENGRSRMQVDAGDKVRIYAGNGGVNHISSFHPIGEIWDSVYIEGSIGSEPLKNIQSTAVLPGGSAIVEFVADVPGHVVLVDHALARMNKGAWAIIDIKGEPRPDIYAPTSEFVIIPDQPAATTSSSTDVEAIDG